MLDGWCTAGSSRAIKTQESGLWCPCIGSKTHPCLISSMCVNVQQILEPFCMPVPGRWQCHCCFEMQLATAWRWSTYTQYHSCPWHLKLCITIKPASALTKECNLFTWVGNCPKRSSTMSIVLSISEESIVPAHLEGSMSLVHGASWLVPLLGWPARASLGSNRWCCSKPAALWSVPMDVRWTMATSL